METQKSPNSQSNLEKEKWSWRNQAPWLQTILQSYSHQNNMVLAQKQKLDQWNRIESPEINACIYGQLIYDKGGKTIQWRKDSVFNKWCLENWTATCKRMKLEHSLIPSIKINSKWIKDLNVRPDTIKFLEENIGRTLFDINGSNIFLDPSPRLMEIKTKINKRDLIKSFCTAKESINKVKTTYRMGENICKQCYRQGINLQNIQTAHTAQYQKNKQPNWKMGRRSK